MATFTKISELTGANLQALRDQINPTSIAAETSGFTITDSDESVFEVTTGASDMTATLPTLADNLGREIEVWKVDSGAGVITVDGEGSETINGDTTLKLPSQYNMVRLRALTSGWMIVAIVASYDTGWVANSDWTAADITITHDLGTAEVIVEIEIADDASGTNRVMMGTGPVQNAAVSGNVYIVAADFAANSFHIYTGDGGVRIPSTDGSGSASTLGAASAKYYRVRCVGTAA